MKKQDFNIYCFRFSHEESSVAEALYDTTWSMTQSHRFHELLLGWHSAKIHPFSLELYQENQSISFLFGAKGATADAMAGMMYLNHPTADIIQVQDPLANISPEALIAVGDISYLRPDIYPSNNYKVTICGAMDPVLRAMAEQPPHYKIMTQLVLAPIPATVPFHFYMWMCRRMDRFVHLARPKFWFRDKETREKQLEMIYDKAIGKWLAANLRILVVDERPESLQRRSSAEQDLATHVKNIATGYAMQNHGDWNLYALHRIRFGQKALIPAIERHLTRGKRPAMRMYTREVPGMWQLPSVGNLNFRMIQARHASPPRNLPIDVANPGISKVGTTIYRSASMPFGLRREDRQRHLFILGKNGTGKSSLLQLLIEEDLRNGKGVGVLDPEGGLIDRILDTIPEERVKDVILYDPSDVDYPASLNPFEIVQEESRMRVATGLLEMFRVRFEDQWNDRIEHLFLYTTLALLSTQWTTVLSIKRMLSDPRYRESVIPNIRDRAVREFWAYEFSQWEEQWHQQAIEPVERMIGDFVSAEVIRNSLGQPFNKFNFRQFMDSQKILLMKISNELLGDDNASLLGAMVMTRIYYAAMSRADTPYEMRPDFYLYVDDFNEFATASFEEILSESRKYRLNLNLTAESLGSLPVGVRDTIFGNVGNVIAFRVGNEDAGAVARELAPRIWESDLINLPPREFYMKMMVGDRCQEVFSAQTEDIIAPTRSFQEECRRHSRAQYCVQRGQAHEIIEGWSHHG
ncbi:MAG: helicase HerA domain-containing protein [Bdellovibrionota bacterium]